MSYLGSGHSIPAAAGTHCSNPTPVCPALHALDRTFWCQGFDVTDGKEGTRSPVHEVSSLTRQPLNRVGELYDLQSTRIGDCLRLQQITLFAPPCARDSFLCPRGAVAI